MRSSASFIEAVMVALGSLRASKLRSFLTLLGIILATATLIAVMSVIHGMNRYIATQVSDMGADGFKVRRMPMMGGQFNWKRYLELNRRNPDLTREEFEFLKEKSTLVREFGMEVGRGVPVKYGGSDYDGVGLMGVSPNIGVIRNLQTAAGRFISPGDDRRRLYVCVIGNDIRERFFPSVDPVGKVINVQGRPFEVIGAAAPLGTVFGESRDEFIMIPVETYIKIYGARKGLGYSALAIDRFHLEQAQDEIRSLMRAFRHLGPGVEDNFGMIASDSLLSMWDRMTGAIASTAVAVVSVFMVVGGVVIMNIMLAVVTERTHEIGIRKSVGARRIDILNQFLVESSMLSGAGGLIGVTTAWILAIVVRNFTPVPMAVPVSSIVIGVGLSSVVGLFFGIYPARRAAGLDPIEALRFEK
jgi:putative ABC transport system permease protein